MNQVKDPIHVFHVPVTKILEPPKPKIERKPIQVVETTIEMVEEIEKEVEEPKKNDESSDIDFNFTDPEPVDDAPFEIVEKMPAYNGGIIAFYKFLGENIVYPRSAQRINTEGKVFVKFVVEKDGGLSNIEVIKGIGAGCDLEAIRVMNLVPNFSPGKQRGVPVRVQMVVPINFKLK